MTKRNLWDGQSVAALARGLLRGGGVLAAGSLTQKILVLQQAPSQLHPRPLPGSRLLEGEEVCGHVQFCKEEKELSWELHLPS